jgi:plasmid stabilization system protein ParE
MIYRVEFLLKAKRELLDAWEWYEDRQAGLGDKFTQQVFSCIHTIEKHPDRYPERKKNYKEALVKIFPYLLIYRISKRKKVITIVSVFHGYRNPKGKYKQ